VIAWVQTAAVGFALQAVSHAPPPAVHWVSAVHRESVHTPFEASGAVRLLWWLDMPAGAVNGATPPFVVLSTAELWHRLQTMPYRSHDEYWLASPLTPLARLTTPKGAFEFRSQVIPGKDVSGSFAV
jgi:hypothetical protein